jgi:hypothetical protein
MIGSWRCEAEDETAIPEFGQVTRSLRCSTFVSETSVSIHPMIVQGRAYHPSLELEDGSHSCFVALGYR